MTAILPPNPPGSGNAIRPNPLTWHQMLVSALVVGISVWVVEQNMGGQAAFILALIILLGVMYAAPGFAAELQSIVSGKA